jgi:hypothetical protein
LDQVVTALQSMAKELGLTVTGIPAHGYVQRLRSKGCLTSAANAAGFGNWFEIGLTPAGQRHTAAESCHGLFAKELVQTPTPTPTAPKRVPPAAPAPTTGPTRYIG